MNDLQEEFARLVAETGTLTEAYVRVYYLGMGKDPGNSRPETIHNKAYLLSKKPHVAKRIEHYTRIILDRKNKEFDERLTRTLSDGKHEELTDDRIRSFIREGLFKIAQTEEERTNDRIKAMELLGKLAGVSAFEKLADNQAMLEESKAKQRLKDLIEGLRQQGKIAVFPDKPLELTSPKPLKTNDKSGK